jgi:hypothetical protein
MELVEAARANGAEKEAGSEAGVCAAEARSAGPDEAGSGCLGELDWGMRFLWDRTASGALLRWPCFLVSIEDGDCQIAVSE